MMLFTDKMSDDRMTYHNDPDKLPRCQNINAAAKAFVRVIAANTAIALESRFYK